MFGGFGVGSEDAVTGRRYIWSIGISFTVYASIAAAIILAARTPQVKAALANHELNVVFQAPPPSLAPKAAETPKPAPKTAPTVQRVLAPPTVIPTKLDEAEPDAPPIETTAPAAGAQTGDTNSLSAPDSLAWPSGPIELPTDATPPVAKRGNAAPAYPDDARSIGLEGEVVLKIVVLY